ncbi:MAG TPA: NifU N-terminal domain-containing protein [Tepidisphaeraceae bacterium]|nr:NifU N-terminal domain-containing protein [Tepidisphaeraceae bacterium]
MGFKVAEIQPTPNPNALKFVLDREVADQPASFFSADAASGHPLAARLFAVPGVSSLLLLGDFVTVNKSPEASWTPIKKAIREALTEI